MDGARSESEKLLAEATARTPKRLTTEAERRHARRDRPARAPARPGPRRAQGALRAARVRAQEAGRVAAAALRFVERTLPPRRRDLRAAARVRRRGGQGTIDDEIEAQINEDAEAAAPSIPPAEGGADGATGAPRRSELGPKRRGPTSPPSRRSRTSGPPTEAWQAEPMSILSQGADIAEGGGRRRCRSTTPAAARTGSPEASSSWRHGGRAVRPRCRLMTHGARRRTARPSAVNQPSSLGQLSLCGGPGPRSRARSRAPGLRCGPATLQRPRA